MGQANCTQCLPTEPHNMEIYPLKAIMAFVGTATGNVSGRLLEQDTHLLMENIEEDCHIFAVLDGFGPSGKEAASLARDFIKTYFEINSTRLKAYEHDDQIEEFIKDLFDGAENKMKSLENQGADSKMSGTCCCIVFIKDNKCYIINMGSSRVVLCRGTPQNETQPIDLSADHKLGNKKEKKRILKMKGIVRKKDKSNIERFWVNDNGPGTTATRALGAFLSKTKGMSSEPEIEKIFLIQTDKFIVMATDGVWDVMSTTEVIEFVLNQPKSPSIANLLVEEARKKWENGQKIKGKTKIGDAPNASSGFDDITVIVIYMDFYNKKEAEENQLEIWSPEKRQNSNAGFY